MSGRMKRFCLTLSISVCTINVIIYLIVSFNHLWHYVGIKQSIAWTSQLTVPKSSDNFTDLSVNLTSDTLKPIIPKSYYDFIELSKDLRTYASKPNDSLRQKLFPWLFKLQDNFNDSLYTGEKNSKGIVICTGSKHLRLTLVALKALELIENELSIEIVYSNSNDLSVDNQQALKKQFPKVRLVDLSLMAFNDSFLKLRGWEIKPFSVLASRFEQVLLMDADVLFLEKPSILFDNEFYTETGALFFYDRPTLSYRAISWIRKLSSKNSQPIPSRTQESGVVLIDKSRVYLGLLSICKLNDDHERERVTYKYLHGDKDTWWLGFHIINMPYSFIPTMTASIGQIMSNWFKEEVCGHILHMDEDYRPIWWNGGMFRNRYVNTNEMLNIEGWLEEGHWRLRTYSCLRNRGKKVKQFSIDHQQLITGYIQLTKEIFN